jgi:hypothetical protein
MAEKLGAKCVYTSAEPIVSYEGWREGLTYSGTVGDFDRLVADGYDPDEAYRMVVDGEI